MIENGIYYDISHAMYHAMTDRVSNSYLSRLAKCPAAARVKQEETAAMTFGRALHSFILDGPTAFSRDVLVLPEINRRTNAGKEEYQSLITNNPEKAIINQEDLQAIVAMDQSVKSHPLAKQLIGDGTTEVSVFWNDPFSGLPCKARPDIVPDNVRLTLIDLKKVRSAEEHAFLSSITTYGYHRQGAMYLDAMRTITQDPYDLFVFIAIEEDPPYRCEVYPISNTFIERGRTEYRMLMTVEANCRAANHWPNYKYPQGKEIDMPKWMAYQEGD